MTKHRQLDAPQLQLLHAIGTSGFSSLLRIRSTLSWELSRFATAMHALEEAQLIQRDGLKAKCTEAGASYIENLHVSKPTSPAYESIKQSYSDEVRAPQLPVNALWLPNLSRFLGAIGVRK